MTARAKAKPPADGLDARIARLEKSLAALEKRVRVLEEQRASLADALRRAFNVAV